MDIQVSTTFLEHQGNFQLPSESLAPGLDREKWWLLQGGPLLEYKWNCDTPIKA